MSDFALFNANCINGATKIRSESVDLGIYDPPFGINEGKFGSDIYRREWDVGADCVMPGYVEAPSDYYEFTQSWLTEAQRILKPNGTIYIISGWTHLGKILRVVSELGLIELNHCIWKYNFGVFATRKFVSSHYHILRLGKTKEPKFNTYCRFGPQEKDGKRSSLFADLEDVFVINKEYRPGEVKNKNKLPNALIEKLVLYSSNPGDLVCDFFMGNFTTAYVALTLGRKVLGFEQNAAIFKHHLPLIRKIKFGSGLVDLKQVQVVKPPNAGKPMSEPEQLAIAARFDQIMANGSSKKDALAILCQEFGRGHFGIYNVVKAHQLSNPGAK